MRVLAVGLAILLLASGTPGAAGSSAGARHPGPAMGPGPGPVPAAPLPAPPGRTTLLSTARNGGFANQGSIEPSMSANGRFVAFTSIASNLVANDEPGSIEVFLLDRQTDRIRRVPLPEGLARDTGAAMTEPSISADGSVVAYTYRPANRAGAIAVVTTSYVFAWIRDADRVEFISVSSRGTAVGGASQPSVSGDGRYVAYTTIADQPGDKDDREADVVRFDRRTDTTVLVSQGFNGEPISGYANAPSISGDGNLIAFVSDGGDSVVDEDTGSGRQVYVRNVAAATTEQVSTSAGGGPPRDEAYDPAIAADGRYVAFVSEASNLTAEGSGGLFRRDRRTNTTIMVSVTPDGAPANQLGGQPSITADGNIVAWASSATNLVPETAGGVGATRLASEVYIRDVTAGETLLVSVSLQNGPSLAQSFQPSVGGNGRFIAFASASDILVRGDDNEVLDVFLRDLPPVPVITPSTLDLGARAVGTESLPLAATLGNAGWMPLRVSGASIGGADEDDFRVVADGCEDRVLRRNDACTVSVVFEPSARGNRTATLQVADSHQGSPRTVRLRGRASQGRVELDPPIGNPGIVTIAEGSGFPPQTAVRLSWSEGITAGLDPVVTDARGRFRVPILVFHNDRTGRRELLAEPADGTAFPSVAATMLVTRPSVIPPRFEIVRFIDIPLVLVIRG